MAGAGAGRIVIRITVSPRVARAGRRRCAMGLSSSGVMDTIDAVNAVRLSATSYVVLGMIALRGPSTPYDIKLSIGRTVGHSWHFPHAQLYAEPDRLVALGLLELSAEHSGRRRKTYSLTAAGRDALRAWLAAPTDESFQVRDVAELKLFFTEIGEPENVIALAHEQIKQHQERIAAYEDLAERRPGPLSGPRMLTVELDLELEHAALRFWRAVADDDLAGLRGNRDRPS
jgi:PadR family transcriptional regulator AphA